MRLFVCLEGEIAGTLELRGSSVQFSYSEDWLNGIGTYPVSQAWPLQPTAIMGRVVRRFLWGLLPDNERTLDAWARRFQISARNPVALLSHVGEDCAGAVQFVREDRLDAVLAAANETTHIEWLEEAQLERRIQQLARDAGAARENATERTVFSLRRSGEDCTLFRPASWALGSAAGRTPTTHILKPATDEFAAFDLIEHFCLTLARRVGLDRCACQELFNGIQPWRRPVQHASGAVVRYCQRMAVPEPDPGTENEACDAHRASLPMARNPASPFPGTRQIVPLFA